MLNWRNKVLSIIFHSYWWYFKQKLKLTCKTDPQDVVLCLRKRMAAMAKPLKEAQVVAIESTTVKGLWIKRSNVQTDKVILYFHGGAYVLGSALLYARHAYHLAMAANVNVFLVDYRLAPEHTFPAPLEDAMYAYQYLLEQGIKPKQIIMAGDSAGGGLAMAALLNLRDHHLALPLAYIGISPWFDLALTGASLQKNKVKDYMVKIFEPWILNWRDCYLQQVDADLPLASPLYAELHKLPPMLLQVGEHDVLLDDALRFTCKAEQMGNQITCEVWEHMPHDWHLLARWLPEAHQAIQRIGAYVKSLPIESFDT